MDYTKFTRNKILIILFSVIVLCGAFFFYFRGKNSHDNITQNAHPATNTEGIEEQKVYFKEKYEDLPVTVRDCIKKVLGNNFDTVYNSSVDVISSDAQEEIRTCVAETTKADIGFREFYESQGKSLQECLKTGLGDEFDKLYNDTKAKLTEEHADNMVKCLNL